MTTSNEDILVEQRSYDQTPYTNNPTTLSHPARIAAVAALAGIDVPRVPSDKPAWRVLELGCGRGGNLLAMAESLPNATLLGIDLSGRQIAEGQAVIKELGLKNIELRQMDLMDVGADLGTFDFVIAHGVYSWVPAIARDKTLSICKQNLAAHGVAYVSFNTHPGWRMRGLAREIMLYASRHLQDPAQRLARAREVLGAMAQNPFGANSPYHQLLQTEFQYQANRAPPYLLHDHMAPNNFPFFFHEFAEHVQQHDLQYISDADVSASICRLPQQAQEQLKSLARDEMDLEQYLDFATNSPYRSALLSHAGQKIDRSLDAGRLKDLWIRAAPSANETAINSAMSALQEVRPKSLTGEEILNRVRQRLDPSIMQHESAFFQELLRLMQVGHFTLSALPDLFDVSITSKPRATAYARYQARHGTTATNLLHEMVGVNDLGQFVLGQLDGSREVSQIIGDLVGRAQKGQVHFQKDGQPIRDAYEIKQFVRNTVNDTVKRLAESAMFLAG